MGSTNYPPRRWSETRPVSSLDMHSRYQQSFVSGCRTTINELDSPAFQNLSLIPTEVMMPSHSRIPRGASYTITDSPSTDPGELSDHSSTGWEQPWNNFGFDGRSPPHVKRSRSSTSSPDWTSGLNLSVPPYDSNWPNIIAGPDSSVTPYTPQQNMLLSGFSFPNRFSPLPESPSPPPMYQESMHAHSSSSSAHGHRGQSGSSNDAASRSGSGSASVLDPNVKRCSHCKATQTPLWRRDPSTFKPLCNACGLYLQQRNRLRPQVLIDADTDDGTDEVEDLNYTGPKCSHCGTHQTSVWRRSKTGAQLCNACGVYARLRGKPRPLSLKRNKIKPRSKHPKP